MLARVERNLNLSPPHAEGQHAMRLCFFDGPDRIELADSAECFPGVSRGKSAAAKVDLRDTWQVQRFIRRHFSAPGELQRLRTLLSGLHPLSHRLADEEVVRQIGQSLQNGVLCAYLYPYAPRTLTRVRVTDVAEVEYLPPPRVPTVSNRVALVVPVAQDPEQLAILNAAQDREAARLEEAARHGTPFCAICERMKSLRQQGK